MALGNQNLFAFRTYSAPLADGYTPFNSYTDFQIDWFWLSYNSQSASALANYYANLLILQYIGQPKAFKMVQAIVEPVLMSLLPNQVQDGFNLNGTETAEGVQLDILGKYVGVTRTGDGFSGPITLDDTDFLSLIQMAIIRNASKSSLAAIQSLLNQFFPGEIYIFDYANMNMSYLISTSVGNQDLIDLFVTEGLLPKPMGVGISVIAAPVINAFFAVRTYLSAASSMTVGLQTYGTFVTTKLFLTYTDSVPPPKME